VTCKHDGISHTGMVDIETRPRTGEGQYLNGSDNHNKEIGRYHYQAASRHDRVDRSKAKCTPV
jgi:hypothetical protein